MRYRVAALIVVGVLSVTTLVQGTLAARLAEADTQFSDFKVSTEMTDKFEPSGDIGIEFAGDNHGVFVTFAYKDLPSGSGLGRIVRFGGSDYNWDNDLYGRANCCNAGGSGRYGFRVLQLDGRAGDLPGGSYEARIYLNGSEVGWVGWGIRGTGGRDSNIPGRPNTGNQSNNGNGGGSGGGNGNGNDNS